MDIAAASADMPPSLNFNNSTLSITGQAPSDVKSEDTSITVREQYGDTVTQTLRIVFKSRVFLEISLRSRLLLAGHSLSF